MYMTTQPYDHPVNMVTLLLWPLCLPIENAESVILLLEGISIPYFCQMFYFVDTIKDILCSLFFEKIGKEIPD